MLVAPVRAQSFLVYPATSGEPLSPRFWVTVNSQKSPVYIATVGYPTPPQLSNETTGQVAFTSFDISAPVQVMVIFSQSVREAKVLPSSSGITPKVNGMTVSFTVSQPGQYTVEVNGDWNNSLHLFVNPMETNVPSPTDPNVIYFAPGIHRIGTTVVGSGKTVYLAPGAVVYGNPTTPGSLFFVNGTNITFRGRGIIDGSKMPHGVGSLIVVDQGSNVQIEGVTFRDPSGWNLHLNNAQNVQISNIKVMGWRINGDGTDVDNSQNVSISNSFYRAYDDLIVVKTLASTGLPSSNVQVTKCVLWNQVAHALSAGAEAMLPIQNVVFSDSDIIHDKGRDALLAILHGDSAVIQGVIWSNIRIEESQRLASLVIDQDTWSTSTERGHIANATFTDIAAPAPSRTGPNVNLQGYDSDHAISGVTFNNVSVGGSALQITDVTQNPYVSAVSVTP